MPSSERALRGILLGVYWIVAFVILFLFSLDDPFCARPGARNHLLMTGQLALALAAYDLVVSLVVAAALNVTPTVFRLGWARWLIAALVVGFGVACLPFWIYRGYGHFRFESTWADVSCFFTEGYGLSFSFVVAPLLAVATFVREFTILRFQR